jgi:phage head maturation protease
LFQRIEFACDVNPMARIAHGLYKGGFLSGVSVGFVPLKWQEPSSSSSSSSSSSDSPRRVYIEQELLEVSAVAIPANPNALALAYKSGAVEKADLKELSTLLNCTLSAQASGAGYPQSTIHHPPASEDLNLVLLQRLNAVLRKT